MKKYRPDVAARLEEKSKLLEIEIDRRKLAENALRINKERYGEAQAVGLAGNWEYNPQSNHFWGSEEAKRIYGFNPEDDDFSVDEVENCILERERVHQALVDLIEVNKPYNLEFEIHPRNSLTPRIISSIAELKRDEHGSPLLVTGVIRDITERRQAEEKFRHLAAIVESSNDAIIGKSLDGTVISWNKGAERTYGYSADEMKGKSILCIVPLDRRDEIEWILEKIRRGEAIIPFETERINKDGAKIWVSLTVSPVKNTAGGITGASTIARDIAERKQAEMALQQSEEKYRSIFENSPEGIYQSTPEGRFISVNPALAHIYGYDSPEEMMAAIVDIGSQLYVYTEERIRYKNILEKFGTVLNFETQSPKKNGEVMWVSLNAREKRNADGDIACYDGFVKDITSRKMAEIDLEETAEKLRKSLMNTIQALSVTVEIRDPYTSGHQKRVSKLTRAIAQGMDLPKDTVDNICMASIIHDIGKLSLPAEILSKPGILSDIEFSLIKTHSQSGYDIIKDIGLPYPIAEMVLQHHEKIDGSGYPRGLKNGQILLESKIITVADVVEAMASHRPYRPALGIDAALEEIENYKGILYDPAVVDICLELFRQRGFTFED